MDKGNLTCPATQLPQEWWNWFDGILVVMWLAEFTLRDVIQMDGAILRHLATGGRGGMFDASTRWTWEWDNVVGQMIHESNPSK